LKRLAGMFCDKMFGQKRHVGSPFPQRRDGDRKDVETVKNNYYKLVKEYHPDRYLTVDDPSIKDKVIAILEAITKAYSLLKKDDRRKNYFHKQRLITRMNSFLNALKKRRDDFFESLEKSELVNTQIQR